METCMIKTVGQTPIIGYGVLMKWGILVLFLVVMFFVYRYIKNINKRFASIEEILGKVIEKNNQIQHLIQSTMRYPQSQPVSMSSSPPPPPCHVASPPVAPQSIPSPPNLDREIMEELMELDTSPPPESPPMKKTVVSPPVLKKSIVEEEEIVEGRVEEVPID